MEVEEYDTFNDRLFQCGMWLKYGGEYVHVTHISENGITTRGVYREWYSMLATHEFLDGTPCGKLSEESNA